MKSGAAFPMERRSKSSRELKNEHFGMWNYRFKMDGKEYSGTTDLAAAKQNMRAAQDKESDHRQ
jgi:hypothetical protein